MANPTKGYYVELVNGKEFKGDGSYGSAGRELFLYIKSLSLKMMKKEVRINFDEAIVKPTTCTRMDCNYRTTKLTRFQRFLKFMLKPRGIVRL